MISVIMHQLFQSVSPSDPLQFWASHGLDYRGVARFLDFDADDLSKLSGVKKASVRLDDKIPKPLSERLAQIANICSLVADYFNGNSSKTALWFRTPNPMLGYTTPRDMIRLGRYERLLRFVQEAQSENTPHDKAPAA